MEYSNMFFNYRIASVWSAPECLAQQRRIVEGNIRMDSYSYGIILWELWHQEIPFDNDVSSAKQYVMEESRPQIISGPNDLSDDEEDEDSGNESFRSASNAEPLDEILSQCQGGQSDLKGMNKI
jgi:hypothetical protein